MPSVSFSPCGKFIASTSIDHSCKIWQLENGKWQMCKTGVPDRDYGWAVRWVNRKDCLPIIKF